jgi:PleD family two-component response regulator
VSAGLTGDTGDSLEAMLKTADEQLYKSKQKGRNCLSCAEG